MFILLLDKSLNPQNTVIFDILWRLQCISVYAYSVKLQSVNMGAVISALFTYCVHIHSSPDVKQSVKFKQYLNSWDFPLAGRLLVQQGRQ